MVVNDQGAGAGRNFVFDKDPGNAANDIIGWEGPRTIFYRDFENVVVQGGNGRDRFEIYSTRNLTNTYLHSGGDSDQLFIGNDNLDNIIGNLFVDGGEGGQDILAILDQLGTQGRHFTISQRGVSWTGFTPRHDNIERINVLAGNHDDIFDVLATRESVVTNLSGGNGNDIFRVGNLLNQIGEIRGALEIDGGIAGVDQLFINDQGTEEKQTYNIGYNAFERFPFDVFINYETIEFLNLNGAQGGNSIYITAVPSFQQTIINAGLGNDFIVVGMGLRPPITRTLDDIKGQLSVNGLEGTNVLFLDDSLNSQAQEYVVKWDLVNRLGGPTIYYKNCLRPTILEPRNPQAQLGNKLEIASLAPGTELTIIGGNYNDLLTFNLEEPLENVIVQNDADAGQDTVAIFQGSLASSQMSFANGEALEIYDNGVFNLDSSFSIPDFLLNGGTLTGPADLTVKNTAKWYAGTMSGTGLTYVDSGDPQVQGTCPL